MEDRCAGQRGIRFLQRPLGEAESLGDGAPGRHSRPRVVPVGGEDHAQPFRRQRRRPASASARLPAGGGRPNRPRRVGCHAGAARCCSRTARSRPGHHRRSQEPLRFDQWVGHFDVGRPDARASLIGLRYERGRPRLAASEAAQHLFEQAAVALEGGETPGLRPRRHVAGDPRRSRRSAPPPRRCRPPPSGPGRMSGRYVGTRHPKGVVGTGALGASTRCRGERGGRRRRRRGEVGAQEGVDPRGSDDELSGVGDVADDVDRPRRPPSCPGPPSGPTARRTGRRQRSIPAGSHPRSKRAEASVLRCQALGGPGDGHGNEVGRLERDPRGGGVDLRGRSTHHPADGHGRSLGVADEAVLTGVAEAGARVARAIARHRPGS